MREYKEFMFIIRNVEECEYEIECINEEGEILKVKKEYCLDDCFNEINEFVEECRNEFNINMFDSIKVVVDNVYYGM